MLKILEKEKKLRKKDKQKINGLEREGENEKEKKDLEIKRIMKRQQCGRCSVDEIKQKNYEQCNSKVTLIVQKHKNRQQEHGDMQRERKNNR